MKLGQCCITVSVQGVGEVSIPMIRIGLQLHGLPRLLGRMDMRVGSLRGSPWPSALQCSSSKPAEDTVYDCIKYQALGGHEISSRAATPRVKSSNWISSTVAIQFNTVNSHN